MWRWAVWSCLGVVSVAAGAVNQPAIDDVAAGRRQEAKASWWGFDATDATACLQAAIDSKVPKLIVDNVGATWVVNRINLVSNQEIIFEPGVEVRALRGAFKGTSDSLLNFWDIENVTLRGPGATLRMWREDYDNPELYQRAEWRHVLNIRSSRSITIEGLTLAESGGDGIYLGVGKTGGSNVNVVIRDVICDQNYRQGISVITADGLLIEDTVMRATRGTAPQAGIDFEPNHPREMLRNCVMRNCTTESNASLGYHLYLPNLHQVSEPVSIRLENCRSIGDLAGLSLVVANSEERAVRGTIEVVDCEFVRPAQYGIVIGDKPVGSCTATFTNCRIVEPATDHPTLPPILLRARENATRDIGGVVFDRVTIEDPLGRNPMAFHDATGSALVADVTGQLLVAGPAGPTAIELTPERLQEWMPGLRLKRYPRYELAGRTFRPLAPLPADAKPTVARLRREAELLVYAEAGETVRLALRVDQVGRYALSPAKVTVTGPAGDELAKLSVPGDEEPGEVVFTALATGLHRVVVQVGQNAFRVVSGSHPVVLTSQSQPIWFIRGNGWFYFYVPAGTTEFGVRVNGQGTGEAIKATLYNAAGEVVGEADDVTVAYQFEVEGPFATGEVWSIELARPSTIAQEDHYLALFGVPPFVAGSPEAVLVAVE